MHRPTLIFDLDGTLAHSLTGIAASLNRALSSLGFAPHPEAVVRRYIGNGARMLATRALPGGADGELIDRIEQSFKTDYSTTWHEGTTAYAGIPSLLAELTTWGVPMAVLSNKPHPFTTAMVRSLFPGIPFSVVIGQRTGVPHKPAPDGVLEIAVRLDSDPRNCWMIGDSTTDMETARNSGAHAIAVSWGYHDRESLAARCPDLILDSPSQLASLLADRFYSSPSLRSLP